MRKILSQKGFTLVELLIIISIMAIMAAAGVANTMNSQKLFDFTRIFKQMMAEIRVPRMYSVTNHAIIITPGDTPYVAPYYGVNISYDGSTQKYIFKVFADMEDTGVVGKYDDDDQLIGDSVSIDATKYGIKVYDDLNINDAIAGLDTDVAKMGTTYPDDQVTFLYAPPLATYQAEVNIAGVSQSGAIGNIYLKVYSTRNEKDMSRYIAIFSTGIAEGFYGSRLSDIVTVQAQ